MRSRRAWLAAGAAGVVACVVFVLLPAGSTASSIAYQVIALASVLVLVASVLRLPRGARSRPVWWAVVGYVVLTEAGDLVYDLEVHVFDNPPYPGPADAFYLAGYLAAFIALGLLIRRADNVREAEAWIDTAILAIGAACVVGVFIVEPVLLDDTQTGAAAAISVAYPLLDVVLLSGLARLLVGNGRINPAILLLTSAFALTLIADLVFNYIATMGDEASAPAWLDVLYLVAFMLIAAAANSRGARTLRVGRVDPVTSSSQVRLSTLALGALIVPVVLVYITWADDEDATEIVILAVAIVAVIVLVLWRFRLVLDVVEGQSEQLASLARTDSLTGLPNRRTLDFELERIEAQTTETGTPLTIAMMDLDHFKDFNDINGHQAGDHALIDCAHAWSRAITPPHVLARYGGEEFAVLLPGLGLAQAQPLLEDLRTRTPGEHTVSIGYAERRPGESGFETMSRADRALYLAKQTGRNRTLPDRPLDHSVRQ